MKSQLIIERKIIDLSTQQKKLVDAGWGKSISETTFTEKIVYLSDGIKVIGYVSYPKNIQERLPCIVWNRGGARKRGMIDEFSACGIFGKIASWGYIVFASMYRGSVKSCGCDMFGGDDVNDVLNLIPLAEEFEQADTSKWGMEGWSRGGLMTYLALMQSSIFKCAVVSGGITDLGAIYNTNKLFNVHYKDFFPIENIAENLAKRSPIHFANKLPFETKYLLLHGASDDVVPVNQSLKLAEIFSELNYNYRLVVFEKGDHYLKRHRKEADEMKRKFFSEELSGKH